MLEKTSRVIRARAAKRGLPPVSQARIRGAILSYFFLRHHEAILAEHADVATETTREYLGKHFSPEELAGLVGPEVSTLLRDGEPEDVRAK
jgi:hypothetical protein